MGNEPKGQPLEDLDAEQAEDVRGGTRERIDPPFDGESPLRDAASIHPTDD